MHKDFKIGLALGLALVVIAAVWLSTRPSLSPQERMREPQSQKTRQGPKQPQEVTSEQSDLQMPTPARSDTDNIRSPLVINQLTPTNGTISEEPRKIKTQRFHIVQKGETLSAISAKYYGSANQWPKIFQANRDVIKDADRIIPGTKLIIPD